MKPERRVVDDRVFLLGLDKLYRSAMMRHESDELLHCARQVARALRIAPAPVPVEGYYAASEELTEYFRLVRALQQVADSARPSVEPMHEYLRLQDVASSPLYGRSQYNGMLLPTGHDPLAQALVDCYPEWSTGRLLAAAYQTAIKSDDFSLVGLAVRIQDEVVVAALRESVVLYAQVTIGAALNPPEPEYIWMVNKDLADYAKRFVDAFNGLFGDELPLPTSENAETYWHAGTNNEVLGRCVHLGLDDSVSPVRHYHWAICSTALGDLVVQEFWKPEIWTTQRYRSELRGGKWCPEL